MNIKQRLLFYLCATLFRPVALSSTTFAQIIQCTQNDIQYITDTTFNVIRLNADGKQGYFRECRRHTERREYVNEIIQDYFSYVATDCEAQKIRNSISESLRNPKNFRKFFNMGIVNDPKSRVALFLHSNNAKLIGLENIDCETSRNLSNFVQYVWGEIYAYWLNSGLKTGAYQTFNSSKSISTKMLACLIGVEDLIPYTEYVILKIEGQKERFGTFMKEAAGVAPCSLSKRIRQNVSPEFQRQCNNLNILDVLTYEKDHRPGNYYVTIDSRNIVMSMQAFDNDSPLTFFITHNIAYNTYENCSPIVNNKGIFNRPYIDRNVVKQITNLRYSDISTNLKDKLTTLQLVALWKRILRVRAIVNKTKITKPSFLLGYEEWSEETVQEELTGKYGNTYLVNFCTSSR